MINRKYYRLHFMCRDTNGSLDEFFVRTSVPVSKTKANNLGKEYAKKNNVRFYGANPDYSKELDGEAA